MLPGLLVFLMLLAVPLAAQQRVGEIRIAVYDGSGLPLSASGELISESSQVRLPFRTSPEGVFVARSLPFGSYRLSVERQGFSSHAELLELSTEVPVERRITLQVAGVETAVTVSEPSTLLSPLAPRNHVGKELITERRSSQPARGLLELVQTQPGWLLEANGVLHPRGSEYDTQYVLDGVPILDNRSPAFAPALEPESMASITVLTAGYPAEYGRKLGGVVELVTAPPPEEPLYGQAIWQTGRFGTNIGSVSLGGRAGRSYWSVFGASGITDRYLDPPSPDNFTNHATLAGAGGRLEHEFNDRNRLRLQVSSRRSSFLVPNTLDQQEAGQRQDRQNEETQGYVSWTSVLSPNVLFAARGMVRDLNARFWSNALSTPIHADQDRGFREGYASASIAAQFGRHEFKLGTDVLASAVREQFGYRIVDFDEFDDDLPATYRFEGARRSREHSVFIQDRIRLGRLTISAGLRWDAYRFLVNENAFSPRLGVSWYWPEGGLLLRASYDRIFQTPAIENLLLASSESAQRLSDETTGLPVPPSRGHFFEVGFSKGLWSKFRLDGSYYRRDIRNFADDDVFLNSGVSFPVSFAEAFIHGFEARLDLPRWGRFSGFLTYSNLTGLARLPVTGGLLLEEGVEYLLSSHDSFPITQDQRNTAYGRLRYQISRRAWTAVAAWYGSGLPFEREPGEEDEEELEVEDRRILNRVNLERGRVLPSYSLDWHAGVTLIERERRRLSLQAEVLNLTNQLNVINFSGVFSGTALAPPRSFALRLQASF
jgi:Outer membrane receptor proteins, mostly Fe transport